MFNVVDEWLDADKSIYLIDVREPAEYEIVRIPGSRLVPKGEILSGNALASMGADFADIRGNGQVACVIGVFQNEMWSK